MRVFAEEHLTDVKEQLRALSSPPKTVLAKVRYFYDRTAELGKQGMNENLILDQLKGELSDIGAYNELLRLKSWGYRLGQSIIMRQSLKNK